MDFENIPDQSGKVVIVTGANSGIGFEVSKALARRGARVIMACRNVSKAKAAMEKILLGNPDGKIEIIQLDLSDLSSVKKFTVKFLEKYDRLDILCNNAGIMMPPYRKTADGFELQMGTNHLGHFALTGLLIETLIKTGNSRIVTMSSVGHRFGGINFDDLHWEKEYTRYGAYGQSKLANLLFAYELQRRLEASGAGTISLACHPGYTRTNLARESPLMRMANPLFGQPPLKGALPMLYAATAPGLEGSTYYGPRGYMESRGQPKQVDSNEKSHDVEDAKRLWEISETLTGVKFTFSKTNQGYKKTLDVVEKNVALKKKTPWNIKNLTPYSTMSFIISLLLVIDWFLGIGGLPIRNPSFLASILPLSPFFLLHLSLISTITILFLSIGFHDDFKMAPFFSAVAIQIISYLGVNQYTILGTIGNILLTILCYLVMVFYAMNLTLLESQDPINRIQALILGVMLVASSLVLNVFLYGWRINESWGIVYIAIVLGGILLIKHEKILLGALLILGFTFATNFIVSPAINGFAGGAGILQTICFLLLVYHFWRKRN